MDTLNELSKFIDNELSKFIDNLEKIKQEEKKSYYQKKMEATETSEEYQEDQFLSKNK